MTAPVERIVVALDAASESRTAIGTAVRLAARWKASERSAWAAAMSA